MSPGIDDSLKEAIQEVRSNEPELGSKGALIIYKNGNEAEFFQYSVDTDEWMLDFPPGPGNSPEQAEKIKNIVQDKAIEVSETGVIGGVLRVSLDPDTDIQSLSKTIIETIWPDCNSIETEIVR